MYPVSHRGDTDRTVLGQSNYREELLDITSRIYPKNLSYLPVYIKDILPSAGRLKDLNKSEIVATVGFHEQWRQ